MNIRTLMVVNHVKMAYKLVTSATMCNSVIFITLFMYIYVFFIMYVLLFKLRFMSRDQM